MAVPPGRTFSFEHDDDRQPSFNNEQERFHHPHPYHDPPSRDIISPPPQYASPPPREPVSPVSPSSSFGRNHPRNYADGPIRRRSRSLEYSQGHLQPSAHDIPPLPPPHRQRLSHDDRRQPVGGEPIPSARTLPRTTPDGDHFGNRAEGAGLDHIAMNVAERNQRQSGVELMRAVDGSRPAQGYLPPERGPTPVSSHEYNTPPHPATRLPSRHSYSSNIPLAAGAATPGTITPGTSPGPRSSRYSGRSIRMDEYPAGYASYHDSPYQSSSLGYNPAVSEASIDPYNIADDGDDGFIPDPKRRSLLNLSRQSSRRGTERSTDPGDAIGPAAGAGGLFARKQKNIVPSNGYDAVRQPGETGNAGKTPAEKSDWLSRQTKGNKRMGWTVGLVIGAVVILAMIGGIVGGVLGTRSSSSSGGGGSTNNAASDTATNGDLDLNSPEIQRLMNNKNLHKVFPGLDYTPWGTQYPLCLTYPPSQNNVTRDMAVLSQLTNAVRLYGTDCNQTEMVLHSIEKLKLTDMKVWLGVWIDQTNQTTNDRQLAQMYHILANASDPSIFKGAIIGNEALFHASSSAADKAASEASLINTLTEVKANFTQLGYKIPVATSDLGDNWNGELVNAVDIVMSNIHPFFAGVNASVGAAWTLDFWNSHDQVLTAAGTSNNAGKQQIIAETGWPSGGGTDCGGSTGECTPGQPGAVASIADMNTFMDSWVCQALANGTQYFWFEAFDEPWKIIYDTPTQQWEDKWGLMDQARNLKTGLTIPDCGGKTVG